MEEPIIKRLIVKVNEDNSIPVPSEIMKYLGVLDADQIDFEVYGPDTIELKPKIPEL